MLALLAAMKEEVDGLKKRLAIEEMSVEGGWQILKCRYWNREVLLVQTGLGKERAEKATRYVLEHYPVKTVISFGFAGGLAEKLKVGDIVFSSILCGTIAESPSGELYYYAQSLLNLGSGVLVGTGARFYAGKSLTIEQVVTTRGEKRALGEAYGADFVDMESYWVARLATNRNIPFLSVRAISDTASDNLPEFSRMLDANGNLLWNRAIIYFLWHPWQLINLVSLYRHVRQAGRSLTFVAERLVANS